MDYSPEYVVGYHLSNDEYFCVKPKKQYISSQLQQHCQQLLPVVFMIRKDKRCDRTFSSSCMTSCLFSCCKSTESKINICGSLRGQDTERKDVKASFECRKLEEKSKIFCSESNDNNCIKLDAPKSWENVTVNVIEKQNRRSKDGEDFDAQNPNKLTKTPQPNKEIGIEQTLENVPDVQAEQNVEKKAENLQDSDSKSLSVNLRADNIKRSLIYYNNITCFNAAFQKVDLKDVVKEAEQLSLADNSQPSVLSQKNSISLQILYHNVSIKNNHPFLKEIQLKQRILRNKILRNQRLEKKFQKQMIASEKENDFRVMLDLISNLATHKEDLKKVLSERKEELDKLNMDLKNYSDFSKRNEKYIQLIQQEFLKHKAIIKSSLLNAKENVEILIKLKIEEINSRVRKLHQKSRLFGKGRLQEKQNKSTLELAAWKQMFFAFCKEICIVDNFYFPR